MKKDYLTPAVEALEYEASELLSGSQATSGGDVDDIGYGGIDDEGTHTPTSRLVENIW